MSDESIIELCSSCAHRFSHDTIQLVQPIARIPTGSRDRHRLMLDHGPYGHLTSIVSSAGDAGVDAPRGPEIGRDGVDPTGALIVEEKGVNVPIGRRPEKAYDLALFEHASDKSRGILRVSMVVRFVFQDGVSRLPATALDPLPWLDIEKDVYARMFVTIVENAWSGKHELHLVSGRSAIKRIAVEVTVTTVLDPALPGQHWLLTATKVDGGARAPSSVSAPSHDARFDSFDLWATKKKGGNFQIPVAHEFGHMLGLPDEYSASSGRFAIAWLSDTDSMMNTGATVRDRHYAPFADWVSGQLAALNPSAGKPPKYRVNGTVDLSNAELES